MAKNPTEIMEIFASYDLTRCAWSAAQLVGCDPKTVQRYVAGVSTPSGGSAGHASSTPT